ncbi:O-antigen ligase family protein [Rhodococcus sp. 1R11]|uniref:O-antigen ligase family protein n=1 Tax=Rhodococcus sp. 1R11 TaxID=2559614 RepID=UPI0014313C87|nr:O-antigen ligase family protein [Rhodococcus sp. 1R11]
MSADRNTRDRIIAFGTGVAAITVDLQVGGAHAFTVLVLVWVFLHLRRRPVVPGIAVLLLISSALIASTVLVGDLVGNPQLAIQLLALTVSAILLAAYTTPQNRLHMMYGALVAVCFGCVYGLGQIAGIFPSRAGLVHIDVSAIGRPSGIWPEPDWLGIYAGVGILLAFHLPLKRWMRIGTMALCTMLWVLSFARAGWLALAGVAILAGAVHLVGRRTSAVGPLGRDRRLAIAGSAAAVLLPILYFRGIAEDLAVRLSRTFSAQSDDISGQARIQQTDGLLHLADIAPWYGHGLSSAGRVGVSGKLYFSELGSGNYVASNWLLGLWVDAQYLAIPFIVTIAAIALLTFNGLPGQLVVLVAANSLFSNATFVPVFWFAIALSLAAIIDRRRTTDTSGPSTEDHHTPPRTLTRSELLDASPHRSLD